MRLVGSRLTWAPVKLRATGSWIHGGSSGITPAERHLIMFYVGQCNNFQGCLRLHFLPASAAGSCTRWDFPRRFEGEAKCGVAFGGELLFARSAYPQRTTVTSAATNFLFPMSHSKENIPRRNTRNAKVKSVKSNRCFCRNKTQLTVSETYFIYYDAPSRFILLATVTRNTVKTCR